MNFLKSLSSVKKQKDTGYRCNYCQFECDSQLQMIHHNSSCFFSQYEEMKKNTGSKRIQLKVQDKKQKRAIRNLLDSKRLQRNFDKKSKDCKENLTNITEVEQQKIDSLQNQSKNVQLQLSEGREDSNQKKEKIDQEQNTQQDENDQFMIKGEDNDFLLSMIALKLRSDLRLSQEWPKHQYFPKQAKIRLKSTTIQWQEDYLIENQDLSIPEPNVLNINDKEMEDLFCQSYFEQNLGQIFHKIKKDDLKNQNQLEDVNIYQEINKKYNSEIQSNQEINSNIGHIYIYNIESEKQKNKKSIKQVQEKVMLIPQEQNICNTQIEKKKKKKPKKSKLPESVIGKFQMQKISSQIRQSRLHDTMINYENFRDYQDMKSEVVTQESFKQDNNISSDNEDIIVIDQNSINDKFYLSLEQAHFELTNQNQLKQVHKILRDYYDKVRLDTFDIDKIWRLLKSQHSQNIINYKQLLKCLLDLHEQEKVQLDEKKQIVYLI